MRWFFRRRLINLSWLILACVLLLFAYVVAESQLYITQFFTGWVLLATIFVLIALNLRKKLPMLPVGSVAAWVQLHIYLGLFGIVAYWVHTGTLVPNGFIEMALGVLFLLVTISGILGLILSRVLPQRLTRQGENVLYERILGFGAQMLREVEKLVMQAATEHNSTTIPEFYQSRLRSFFLKPRNFWAHVLQSKVPMHRLDRQIEAIEQYIDSDEKEILGGIAQLVEAKNGLDYQYAAQSLLKRWLFVHIPLTYAMLLLAIAHGVLVYAYGGAN